MLHPELADLIKEAFSDVLHTVEDGKESEAHVGGEVWDCYVALGGLGWRDLSKDAVNENFGSVTFLDTDERHAVFAAWLLASIGEEGSLQYEWTMSILLPDGALWNRCTPSQREAVREFLKFHIQEEFEDDYLREKELLEFWSP